MKRLVRRIVLSLAALSPGVVSFSVQELAFSFAMMLLGLTGAISAAAVMIAVSPKVNDTLAGLDAPETDYPSLLTLAALKSLRQEFQHTALLKVHVNQLLVPSEGVRGFVTQDDQVAMILAHIMAQWNVTDALHLTEDQALELWLIERLLRASPAEAGALAENFTTPNAMLAMRDRVANSTVA